MLQLVPAGLALLAACPARAQAGETAVQQIRLQAFAMPTYVRPAFGGAVSNVGATVGADADFTTRFKRVQASAEFRAAGSGGGAVNEYVYSAGPRAVVDFKRFQPYADLLIGYGSIHFNQPVNNYTHDNSAVYTYGGGVDVMLGRAWAVRADLQRQHWRISDASPAFYPSQFSLGLRYQFHFRNQQGPE